MSYNETVTLIQLKHDQEREGKFKRVEGNPRKLKNHWENITAELTNMYPNTIFTAVGTRSKYNQLLSKYKSERNCVKRSGAEASRWLYWDVFNISIPEDFKYTMEDVCELGHGEEMIFENENKSKGEIEPETHKKIKISDSMGIKKADFMKIKFDAYKSIISLNESKNNTKEEDTTLKLNKLQEDICDLRKEMKENKDGDK